MSEELLTIFEEKVDDFYPPDFEKNCANDGKITAGVINSVAYTKINLKKIVAHFWAIKSKYKFFIMSIKQDGSPSITIPYFVGPCNFINIYFEDSVMNIYESGHFEIFAPKTEERSAVEH